jgi:hypothetical protein
MYVSLSMQPTNHLSLQGRTGRRDAQSILYGRSMHRDGACGKGECDNHSSWGHVMSNAGQDIACSSASELRSAIDPQQDLVLSPER